LSNIYCQRLDLQNLPADLIVAALKIVNSDQTPTVVSHWPALLGGMPAYKRYHASLEIKKWVTANIYSHIKNDFRIGIQVFYPCEMCSDFNPHTDATRGDYILNYLIDTGGTSVATQWYQQHGWPIVRNSGIFLENFDNLILIHSENIPSRTWFTVNSRILHTVVGLERPRISLSIGMDQPFAL
jgi:hypothetical protein